MISILSSLWSNYRFAIIGTIAGLLIGIGIGSWIQFKVKEAEFHELTKESLRIQTELQQDADFVRKQMEDLSGSLEKANEELTTVRTALTTVSTQLAVANNELRNSYKGFTSKLASSPTSCVAGHSVANIVGVLRRSIDENESSNRENQRCVEDLARCAKSAGQCGIHRASLLEQGWRQYDIISGQK